MESNVNEQKKLSENKNEIIKNEQIINDDENIWLGVYNKYMITQNIANLIEKCSDKSLPKELASIHLNNYSICFNQNNIYIIRKDNSTILIKLYLITKNQLIDILKIEYNCNEKLESEKIFSLTKINDEIFLGQYQNELNFYNIIKYIGIFNNKKIYSITSNKTELDSKLPDKEYLKDIYIGLKESFYLYSDTFLIYYLYQFHEIKTTYSFQKLFDIFVHNKNLTNNNNNGIKIKEVDNQQKYWYFLPKYPDDKTEKKDDLAEYNYILDTGELPEFDETTGEFFWNTNDSNWENVNKKINSNCEIKSKVVHSENDSIYNLIHEDKKVSSKTEKDKKSNMNDTLKYIEELNNILDTK